MKYRTLILVLTIIVTGSVMGVVSAQPPGGVPGTFAEGDFTPTYGSMTTPRELHTATLLYDGTVLITGGFDGTANISTAEIYDPETDSFYETSDSPLYARTFHQATLLNDGTVLITGGITLIPDGAEILSSAEIFDPITETFNPTNSSMTTPRGDDHTATLLEDGTVLICGGISVNWLSPQEVPATLTAEIYDPITSTFMPTVHHMKFGRNFHTATLLDNGAVLIAGGVNLGWVTLPKAEIYDPITGSFSAIKSAMTTGRRFHTAILLDDGTVLITGGDKIPSGKPPITVLSSAEIFIP